MMVVDLKYYWYVVLHSLITEYKIYLFSIRQRDVKLPSTSAENIRQLKSRAFFSAKASVSLTILSSSDSGNLKYRFNSATVHKFLYKF